jgi:Flp pilus assembly pilin Flp
MNTFIKNFLNDEDGAVTVDWVVLTAAVVGLGIAGVSAVNTGVTGLADSISTELDTTGVADLGTLGTANTSGTTSP